MSLHVSKDHDSEIAELAYAAVQNVPTLEPNDRNRLGYHVWLFLRGEIPTLEDAIEQARARYNPRSLPREDVILHVQERIAQLQRGELAVSDQGMVTKH